MSPIIYIESCGMNDSKKSPLNKLTFNREISTESGILGVEGGQWIEEDNRSAKSSKLGEGFAK